MKKIFALALAATMAAGAALATSAPAAAHPKHPRAFFSFSFGPGYLNPYPYGYYPYPYPYLYPPLIAPRPRLLPMNYRWSQHVQWCLAKYRTYNPSTNTFFIRKGVPAVCISPFSY